MFKEIGYRWRVARSWRVLHRSRRWAYQINDITGERRASFRWLPGRSVGLGVR